MRYSAVYFYENDNPTFYAYLFLRDGKTMVLPKDTIEYDIISIDNETDIFLTAYWMAIPETHPYYNYGLLLNLPKEDIKLSTEKLISDAVKKLYEMTKARSKPI